MITKICSLNDLHPGETAIICSLKTTGSMRRRLLDIGLIKNTPIECIGKSPSGNPSAFFIRGAVIAIRTTDCANILIQKSS